MTQRANASVIMLVVLVILLALVSGGAFYLFQQERARSLSLDEQLQAVNQRQQMTEAKLIESEKTAAVLDAGLKEARAKIDDLNVRLKEEIAFKKDALSKMEVLQAELTQQQELRSGLEKKLSLVQVDATKTQEQLTQLNARKTELETKIQELETRSAELEKTASGIELGKIVVMPEGGENPPVLTASSGKATVYSSARTSVPAGRQGRVLVINKDYNFVVLNIGSKDGLSVGNEFSVYHNSVYIGDVRVEQLHDTMAAAGFVSPALRDKIQEGDTAVQKVS